MLYMKNNEGFNITHNFDTVYFHKAYSVAKASQVCDFAKVQKAINNNDIAILEFIYKVKFCTLKHIERYCKKVGLDYDANRIDYLYNSRIINICGFVDKEDMNDFKKSLPADALICYFLDDAGRVILEKYGNYMYIEWGLDYALEGAYNIGRYLCATDMYINILATTSLELEEYEASPYFTILRTYLVGLSHYRFKFGDNVYYFLTDIFRSSDSKMQTKKKIKLYESLLATNFWKKYYGDSEDVPMFIVQTDNDEYAKELARMIGAETRIKSFRITTDDRLYKGLGTYGAFLSYDEETEELKEVAIKFFE